MERAELLQALYCSSMRRAGVRVNEKEKDKFRKTATATINKGNPHKLDEVKARVQQLINERKNKISPKKKKKSAAAAG